MWPPSFSTSRADAAARPTRREDVIDDQDSLAPLNRIAMDLEPICTVFKLIFPELDFAGQFLRLAYGNKPGPERQSDRRSEEVPSRLDPDNDIDIVVLEMRVEGVDDRRAGPSRPSSGS